MDVHGEVEFVANDLLVLASEFVSTIDTLGVPVCPVQAVFKHRDGKGVREAWGKSKRTSVQTWPRHGLPWPLGPSLETAQISPSAKAPGGQDGERRMRDKGE